MRQDVDRDVSTLSFHDRELERALPAYLPQQRWFGGKSRGLSEVEVVDTVSVHEAELKLVRTTYRDGDPEIYALPLTRDRRGQVVDALGEPGFNAQLLQAIVRGARFQGRQGEVVATATPHLGKLWAGDSELPAQLSSAEQSNNSVIFGQRLIMKLFRRIEAGPHPEIELSRFLTDVGFPNVAPLAGALHYRWSPERTAALAMLQAYVPNQGDAWEHALDELAGPAEGAIARYRPWARLLGRRTAEMHRALASNAADPAFAPEPTSAPACQAIYESVRSQLAAALAALRRSLSGLGEEEGEIAQQVLSGEPRLEHRLHGLLQRQISASRIRCHGDYHLGQVLFTGGDFVIVDFEGEPARPLSERRFKRWATKDVAAFLRSFSYAAGTAQVEFASQWAHSASESFLEAYWQTAGDAPFVPATAEERSLLIDAMLIEKALYELQYELDNRPRWVGIPLRGIRDLIDQADP